MAELRDILTTPSPGWPGTFPDQGMGTIRPMAELGQYPPGTTYGPIDPRLGGAGAEAAGMGITAPPSRDQLMRELEARWEATRMPSPWGGELHPGFPRQTITGALTEPTTAILDQNFQSRFGDPWSMGREATRDAMNLPAKQAEIFQRINDLDRPFRGFY